jgi:hypothetical protein
MEADSIYAERPPSKVRQLPRDPEHAVVHIWIDREASEMIAIPCLFRTFIVVRSKECHGATHRSGLTPFALNISIALVILASCSSSGSPANSLPRGFCNEFREKLLKMMLSQ